MAGRFADEGITYFVPGLPSWVSDNDLGRNFEKYGHVLRAQVIDEKGAGGKRFGYVTMQDMDSRDQICTDVHLFGDVQVRALLTKESLHAPDVKKIHLSKLAPHISADAIREAFSHFGAVLDVHTPKKVSTGERMNYGFVTFGSEEAFDAAIAAGSLQVDDCTVDIKPSAQSKGEEVNFKGKGKGGWGEDPDAGITRDRKGGFKYFVPGLPEHVTNEDLMEHFSRYGAVIDAAVVTEKGSDVSRGFGYVTMRDADARDKLLNDKHELGGKEINVLLTKDSLSGSVKKVHLGNLREDVSAEAIREVFSRFGQILDVHTPKDMRSGKRQNFGFVTFGDDKAFKAALRAGTEEIDGCRVKIKPAAQTKEGGGEAPHDPYVPMGGKGYDPYMDPWAGKGWDKGCGKGPQWDPYLSGPYGGDPWGGKGWGGKDPYGCMGGKDPYGYKGGPDPWGPYGKGCYGKDPYAGDPYAWGGKGPGGDGMWGGKGDPYGWGGKGPGGPGDWGKGEGYGDPYAGKGGGYGGKGDPYAGKGGKGGGYGGKGDDRHGKGDRGRHDDRDSYGGLAGSDYGRGGRDRPSQGPRSRDGGRDAPRANPYDRYGAY